VNLEIAAVRRVLPVWEDLWPDDKSPHRVLEAAKQAMNGMLSPKAGQSVMGDEGSQYQDLNATNDQKRQDAADVGYAAIAALVEALWDERFDPNNIQSDLEDRYFDILEEDASWIASKVIAGGREDHPDWSAFPDDSDHAKRREFWTWWLDEAVPAAWASEPE
jgi:hypothetical protein